MNITRNDSMPARLRVLEATNNDGWLYVITATELPLAIMGGGPETHTLVTVLSPVQKALILGSAGTLVDSYLNEKLSFNGLADFEAGVRDAIRSILGREDLDDPTSQIEIHNGEDAVITDIRAKAFYDQDAVQ